MVEIIKKLSYKIEFHIGGVWNTTANYMVQSDNAKWGLGQFSPICLN